MQNNRFLVSCSACFSGVFHSEGKCEDKTATSSDNKVAVAVLCDGAGSCSNSSEGAYIASNETRKIISENFDYLYELDKNDFSEYIHNAVLSKIKEKAKELNADISSFSCTLLCAALHEDGRFIIYHIGDGIISARDIYGNYMVLSRYIHKKAVNATSFITQENPPFNHGKGTDLISSFLLMSDGPENFLSYGSNLTEKAKLLIQIPHYFSEEVFINEVSALNEQIKQHGMTDDSSFAIIADRRYSGKMLFDFHPDTRNDIFYIPANLPKSKVKKYSEIFEYIINNNGISYEKICRNIHIPNIKSKKEWIKFISEKNIIYNRSGKLYYNQFYSDLP